jgi:hypothetical protein
MKNGIMIFVAAACIFLLDLPRLTRSRQKRDWFVYGVFLAAGAVIVWLAAPQKRLPSPLNVIIWMFKPVNALVNTWFQ